MSPRNNFPEKLIRRMLGLAGVRSYDLTVVFLTGPQMRKLNLKALGHDYVTDVITFDLGGDRCSGHLDGEIYICPAEARRNARLYGETLERELRRYIAHGILHLLGYNDSTLRQRELMHAKEDALLKP